MSRIAACFARLAGEGRKALVTYITAGDPAPEYTVGLMHDLVDSGADLLEIGVPFSDPMADGPVIQAACERALAQGTRLRDVLDMVAEFRGRDTETPVVLMGYLNPIEAMGAGAFAERAAAAGVDGVLTVDLPPEESAELQSRLGELGMDAIYLLSPTTPDERVRRICESASGFIYYVSLKGTTGSGALDTDAVGARLAALREVTDLPIGVGFGVRDAQSAARVARVADAVVVGSAIVQAIAERSQDPEQARAAARELIGQLRAGVDGR